MLGRRTPNISACHRRAPRRRKKYRDCFLSLPKDQLRLLKLSNIDYIDKEGNDHVFVIGDEAHLFQAKSLTTIKKKAIHIHRVECQVH